MGRDPDRHYGLYRMDIHTGERTLSSRLPLLDRAGDSFGYSYCVYGSYMALELNRWRGDAKESAIYLIKIGEDGGTDLEPIFGGEGNTAISYSCIQMRDGWIFVWATDTATHTTTLCGYDMETGETRALVEDWHTVSTISLRGETLYWFEPVVGFFSVPLEGGEPTLLRACDPPAEYGAGVYDDQYLYLSTSIAQLDALGTVPEERRGLAIYDYQGNLLQFIPATEEARHYACLLSTPEYVFFFDMDSSVLEPCWYLKKADVASGTAELIPVE